MANDLNYLPNIRCPHCKAKIVAAVSGFSGELGVRIKTCLKCGRDYHLNILVVPTVIDGASDGDIASARLRIKWLKQQKDKQLHELLIESQMYEEIYRDALKMARAEYEKRQLN